MNEFMMEMFLQQLKIQMLKAIEDCNEGRGYPESLDTIIEYIDDFIDVWFNDDEEENNK